MCNTTSPAAIVDSTTLSLGDLLRRLHRKGSLLALIRGEAIEQWLEQQALKHGIEVSVESLQQAVNDYRRRKGLRSAEQTRSWLQQHQLSLDDIEDSLRRSLLIERLKEKVTEKELANHVDQHSDRFLRLQLRQIVVPRIDLAQELLAQLYEEGADFQNLARRHSQHPSHANGGLLPPSFAFQLPEEIQAATATADVGEVVGPLALTQGFTLLLIEAKSPPEPTSDTLDEIRQVLFEDWLRVQLRQIPISIPLLEIL